jgi:hypothetical protein
MRQSSGLDEIEDIMQTSGTVMDDVLIIALGRTDLSVTGPNG